MFNFRLRFSNPASKEKRQSEVRAKAGVVRLGLHCTIRKRDGYLVLAELQSTTAGLSGNVRLVRTDLKRTFKPYKSSRIIPEALVNHTDPPHRRPVPRLKLQDAGEQGQRTLQLAARPPARLRHILPLVQRNLALHKSRRLFKNAVMLGGLRGGHFPVCVRSPW